MEQPSRPAPRAERSSAAPAAAAPAPAPQPAAAARGEPLELTKLTGRWDALTERLKGAGKQLLATALEHSSPLSVTAQGDLTIELDEPNDFFARSIADGRADIVSTLREWFPSLQRVHLKIDAESAATPPKRLTDEMVRAERIASLRKRDPVLSAAIDALDLDVAD